MRRVILVHRNYGCDSGCCGHVILVNGVEGDFHIGRHPNGEDFRAFAEKLVASEFGEDHVQDIDWLHTIVVDD
jgi:hypothetical protein